MTACKDIQATRSVEVSASEVDSNGHFNVTVGWNDQPGDNHFVVVNDSDGVAKTLSEVGTYQFDAENGPFTWQGVNDRYGVEYCKGNGTLKHTFTPAETTTTTVVEETTTTTVVDTPETTIHDDSGIPNIPSGGNGTPTTTIHETSTTVPAVTTPDSLPFTGPVEDFTGISLMATVAVVLGWRLVKSQIGRA